MNVNVGKRRFEELVGYPPSQHAECRGGHDYARLDTLLPHPEYGQQAWVCIVSPGDDTADLVRALLTEARDRVAARQSTRD